MVAQVELDRLAGRIIRVVAHPDDGNPAVIIQDVQGIEPGCSPVAMMLKEPINVDSNFVLPSLPADQLLHPLPARIVQVVGMLGWRGTSGLYAKGTHAVAVIPLKMARCILTDKIAHIIKKVCIIDSWGCSTATS